jgi:RNA-binding protein
MKVSTENKEADRCLTITFPQVNQHANSNHNSDRRHGGSNNQLTCGERCMAKATTEAPETGRSNRHMSPCVESFKYAFTVILLFFERGMCLQRLGKVLHVTPSQNVVAKISKIPKIGLTVVDEKLKTVGKIFDIIGPTSSPYVIIKPTIKEPETLANKQLYLLLSKK